MKKLLGSALLGIIALVAATFVATALDGPAEATGNDDNVTLCHRTNSVTNPYVVITVDKSAANGFPVTTQSDHGNHNGPVFDVNAVYPPPHNGDQWGDIIPPFEQDILPDYPGKNWNAAGQAIFRNGCSIPATATPTATSTFTPEPTATDTPEPTSTNTPEPTATSTPEDTATPEPTATDVPPTNTPEPTSTPTCEEQQNCPTPEPTNTVEPTSTPDPCREQECVTPTDPGCEVDCDGVCNDGCAPRFTPSPEPTNTVEPTATPTGEVSVPAVVTPEVAPPVVALPSAGDGAAVEEEVTTGDYIALLVFIFLGGFFGGVLTYAAMRMLK